MGAGRRMKRKQGAPPSFEDLQRAKQQKTNGKQSQGRVQKRSAPSDFSNPRSNKRQSNGSRQGRPIRDVYMSGALGVKSVEEKPAKAVNGTAKSKIIPKEKPVQQEDEEDIDIEDEEDEEASEDPSENGVDLSQFEEGLENGEDDSIEEDEFGSSVFDSEEDTPAQKETMFSEDEDDSDAEEILTAANIAGLSAKLDAQQEADAAASKQELQDSAIQTNLTTDIPRVLPLAEEAASDDEDPTAAPKSALTLAPDLQLLRTRISDTIRVLEDFAKMAEPGRNRSEYRNQLLKDVCAYYTYSPYLAEKLLNLFPPREAFAFFEANESPRPLVIRTNTLKTHRRELAQSLIQRGATVEPVGKWSKVGLQIFESPVPIGATPEYLAGHYILQAATSFLPVMALSPQEHERILDMASAPGGKVTHIAALMKNSGTIFANDSNKARSKALIGNIHRLGAKNIIVCNYDARQFPKVMGGFDRVLLDAPCSGTGVISKDPSIKTNKTPRDVHALHHQQKKQLLLCAIDSVDHTSSTGGIIVYSTCSITIEENEEVVQYALTKRPNIRIADTGLGSFGIPAFTAYMGKTFDPDMKLCKRYYPHTYNVDGFFVCKLQKIGPSAPLDKKQQHGEQVSNPSTTAAQGTATAVVSDKDDGEIKDVLVDPEDEFGGWNEEEDRLLLEKAERRAARRRGLDVRGRKKQGKAVETNGIGKNGH